MKENLKLNNEKHKSFSSRIGVREEWHLLNHPFYRAWMSGALTLPTLQKYAREYYHHVAAFPQYLRNALALPEIQGNECARRTLAENLAEEDGSAHGTSHPELWQAFAKGVGVLSQDLNDSGVGIRRVVSTFFHFSRASWPQALGSLYAYESQVPEIAVSKIEGLTKHFKIQDEKTLAFFQVHKTADVLHRQSLETLMADFSQEQIHEGQRAADLACQALWDFLTEMHCEHLDSVDRAEVLPPGSENLCLV